MLGLNEERLPAVTDTSPLTYALISGLALAFRVFCGAVLAALASCF